MARRVRDSSLDSRSSRAKLDVRHSPYWSVITPCLAVGYRKGARGGMWLARWHDKATGRRPHEGLGRADDVADADGINTLDFWQAQEAARRWLADMESKAETERKRAAGELPKETGPYTVKMAALEYMVWFEAHRKSAPETWANLNASILPFLGDKNITALQATDIRKWQDKIAKTPARLRTRKGAEKQNVRIDTGDPETKRRRRSTANRIMTVLKALLNHAWREGKVPSDDAWRRVRPFAEADSARIRYLVADECRRLVNASNADLRLMVQAALFSGCRYGELKALLVHDFNVDAGTLHIRASKAGKQRHVVLTAEGQTFFKAVVVGRSGGETLLLKGGKPWGTGHQRRPLIEACKNGKIDPPASFHVLRHTYASLLVMAGLPLQVVARNMGHADTRMIEKHYAHLAPSYLADTIRASAPALGLGGDASKVVSISERA